MMPAATREPEVSLINQRGRAHMAPLAAMSFVLPFGDTNSSVEWTEPAPRAPRASTHAATTAPTDPELYCKYVSKRCTNLRAVKRNGGLHSLCEFHRMKANDNQRRAEAKRRERMRATAAASCEPVTRSNSVPSSSSSVYDQHLNVQWRNSAPVCGGPGSSLSAPPSTTNSPLGMTSFDHIEPLQSPASLLEDDINTLLQVLSFESSEEGDASKEEASAAT